MANIMTVLTELGDVEWARLPFLEDIGHHPNLKVYPPFVTWRYRNKDLQIAEKLAKAVASFHSLIGWSFDSTGKNWLLYPSLSTNAFERERVARTNPDYGIRAYDELPILADHIRVFMSENES
jgi:hypothetical protein